MSIGPEVLNWVKKKLITWRIYEAGEGEGEDTGEDKSDLTYSSAGTDFSLLAPGSLCTPQRCVVMLCVVHCFYLGTNSSLAKWLDGYSLGFRNPKVCAFILLLLLSFNER